MADTRKQGLSRKEKRRLEVAQRKRKRLLTVWAPIGVAVLVLAGFLLFRLLQPDIQGLVDLGAQARGHDVEASFADAALPPTGGTHNPRWLNCGIYDAPVDNALAVHSLEHGAVWLAYRPDLPAGKVEALRDQVRGQSETLMSPYPGLGSEVVMSAWGKQLVIDAVPDERIEAFITRYQGQGPEAGATCSGGVGTPVE